jgi:hypothetical protein
VVKSEKVKSNKVTALNKKPRSAMIGAFLLWIDEQGTGVK